MAVNNRRFAQRNQDSLCGLTKSRVAMATSVAMIRTGVTNVALSVNLNSVQGTTRVLTITHPAAKVALKGKPNNRSTCSEFISVSLWCTV